jgi:putative transcriptional regulator
MKVGANIGVTASREMLFSILSGKGPEQYLFALGFAGWNSHQLEDELLTDSWIVAPCNTDIIFSMQVRDRWRAAAKQIGVDFHRYSERSGTA